MNNNGTLLWVDDEIDLLRAHIMFLNQKGYDVETATNAPDAIELLHKKSFDLILLDEMMPGLTGLEALPLMKDVAPTTPVVMVTKSEEENIMNQAVGAQIADYLIKPVNPSQILLSLKKNIHRKEIVAEATQTGYRQEYLSISRQIEECNSPDDWYDVYRKLVKWELELSATGSSMAELLITQKEEANNAFAKYVMRQYETWVNGTPHPNRPLMSHDLLKENVLPLLDRGEKLFLIVIDNFRYDHWKTLAQEIGLSFDIHEQLYMSILPTATQYARNALFSGLLPTQIARQFPDLWVDEDEEEGKNLNEAPLLETFFKRHRKDISFSYHKVNDSSGVEQYRQRLPQLATHSLNVLVVNFIDMLSHARTESKMVRELANDEAAYRSIAQSWFLHSGMSDMLNDIARTNTKVLLTTDHGSIRVGKPVKIIGDRNTNTNLRYKLGKSLNCTAKEVYHVKRPQNIHLPTPNISTTYAFATGNSFFAYPNNYNYYAGYYKDTFQHGGISMEEMLVPAILLTPKKRQ